MNFGIGRFWKALGHFAASAVTATARSADGHSVDVTVFSFNAVTLDPPLILFREDKSTRNAAQSMAVDEYAIR